MTWCLITCKYNFTFYCIIFRRAVGPPGSYTVFTDSTFWRVTAETSSPFSVKIKDSWSVNSTPLCTLCTENCLGTYNYEIKILIIYDFVRLVLVSVGNVLRSITNSKERKGWGIYGCKREDFTEKLSVWRMIILVGTLWECDHLVNWHGIGRMILKWK